MNSYYGTPHGVGEPCLFKRKEACEGDCSETKNFIDSHTLSCVCILLILALCVLSGCGSARQEAKIVGKWDVTGVESISYALDGQLVATADGTIKLDLQKQGFMGVSVDVTYEGTWSITNRKSIAGSGEDTGDSEVYEVTLGKDKYAAAVAADGDGNEMLMLCAEVTKDGKTDIDTSKIVLTGTREGSRSFSSAEELNAQIAQQPVTVSSVRYFDGETEVGNKYENFLVATIQNNSTEVIKNAAIGYVAWDASGYPVVINGWGSGHSDEYVTVDMDHINLEPGQSYSEGGLKLSSMAYTGTTDITTIRAIVASYETMGGEKWVNPLLADWKELYVGKPLNN